MNKLRILLIDDNPDDRILTIHEIKKEFAIIVNEIIDAKEFSKALKNLEYDIVITDYQLRWSNGLEILRAIKKKYPKCPVIMFTGTGNEQIAVEAMKAGLDDYVIKSPKHFVRIPASVRLAMERIKEQQKREHAEKALFESEEKFRNIFESSPNAITVSNLKGIIIECNEAMLKLHRFDSKDEVIGKNAFSLISEKDSKRATENMKKTLKEGIMQNIEYTFLTKNGHEFQAELSASIITDISGKPVSFVALTKDITEQKRAEEEMKKRTLKYQLEDGNLYLAEEVSPILSKEAFKDLLKIGYFGLVVSRTPEREFRNFVINQEFEFLWLAENGIKKIIPPELSNIELKIEGLPRKNVVMLERIDYLIFKNGFDKTLSFVQHLKEMTYLNQNIIIFSIDPTTINDRELRLLEKEGYKIEPKLEIMKLPEVLLRILKFVYDENLHGIKPSYIEIGRELNISKPTVRSRLRKILATGFIHENLIGRRKVLELTETGRNLFNR